MSEFVKLLFHPLSNAIMTVLSGFTALYWIFTFIAGDFFGSDTDAGLDVHGADIDTDVDADTDTDLNDNVGDKPFFQKALEFVNIGKVPFMVVFSTFKFIAWIITLSSSVALGLAAWGWRSVFILLPVFLIAFIITRYATKPLIKVYHAMGYNGEEGHDLMGRIAIMRSTISGNTIGAAELRIGNDVIRVNVQSKTGEPLPYDSEVMIADESADKKYYLVVKEVNLNNLV
ncbi:MAG: DUF1449 family protein [Terrimonas sp.]|nr:DUF1449 family protein [Terrimonas sp.]OJY84796.1 MAG: hypothetical protein BGP13_20165 [Sphingobacteriales bacterium 40-81]